MSSAVYIIHAVDTEGPLYEGLTGLFSEIKENFGFSFEPNKTNLQKLRNQEIDLDGMEETLAYYVREDRVDTYNESWVDIDKMHATFMSDDWRNKIKDSQGNPYVVSWFCMDHVGFNYNPRRRAMGYHEIYKYYENLISEYQTNRDGIYWHYHPASFSGEAHRMGYNYSHNTNLHNEIITRRIIDCMWFPVANRPGGQIESYDINVWLEQWIPFDVANQSMESNPELEAEELAGRIPGRHGDWRGASTEWNIFNPSLFDFRTEGQMQRWISRCLNMNSREANISRNEIRNAFKKANEGQNVLLSYTNHDFRDMVKETESVYEDILAVASEYPDTDFIWVNAVEGFRKVLNLKKESPPEFSVDIDENRLRIKLKQGTVWGPQPFLALKTPDGRYLHDNFLLDGDGQWTYAFDKNSIEYHCLETVGFGCNDKIGNTTVYRIDTKSKAIESNHFNIKDWI